MEWKVNNFLEIEDNKKKMLRNLSLLVCPQRREHIFFIFI
jgi:hypothetical protein